MQVFSHKNRFRGRWVSPGHQIADVILIDVWLPWKMACPLKACYILSGPAHLRLTKLKGPTHLRPATTGGIAHLKLERQNGLAYLSPAASVGPAHKSSCNVGRLAYLRPATAGGPATSYSWYKGASLFTRPLSFLAFKKSACYRARRWPAKCPARSISGLITAQYGFTLSSTLQPIQDLPIIQSI
jgi:hypothetical protein